MRFENRNRNQLKTSANMDHTIITCQYIRNIISLTTNNQANAIIAEGIGALEYFAQFQAEDIKKLCSSVSKPGVTIKVNNPANVNRNSRIPNPGYEIPALCKTSMVLTDSGAEI